MQHALTNEQPAVFKRARCMQARNHAYLSSAYEAAGEVLATVVDNEAELDRDVEGDAEHVGLDGGAEAGGGLEVGEAAEEAAARLGRRLPHLGFHEAGHVGAHRELERVLGALAFARW